MEHIHVLLFPSRAKFGAGQDYNRTCKENARNPGAMLQDTLKKIYIICKSIKSEHIAVRYTQLRILTNQLNLRFQLHANTHCRSKRLAENQGKCTKTATNDWRIGYFTTDTKVLTQIQRFGEFIEFIAGSRSKTPAEKRGKCTETATNGRIGYLTTGTATKFDTDLKTGRIH